MLRDLLAAAAMALARHAVAIAVGARIAAAPELHGLGAIGDALAAGRLSRPPTHKIARHASRHGQRQGEGPQNESRAPHATLMDFLIRQFSTSDQLDMKTPFMIV